MSGDRKSRRRSVRAAWQMNPYPTSEGCVADEVERPGQVIGVFKHGRSVEARNVHEHKISGNNPEEGDTR